MFGNAFFLAGLMLSSKENVEVHEQPGHLVYCSTAGCMKHFTLKQGLRILSSFAACLHFSQLVSSFGDSYWQLHLHSPLCSAHWGSRRDTGCHPEPRSLCGSVPGRAAGRLKCNSHGFAHFTCYKSFSKSFSSSATFEMNCFIFQALEVLSLRVNTEETTADCLPIACRYWFWKDCWLKCYTPTGQQQFNVH